MKTQKLLTPLALAMVAMLSVGAHASGSGASADIVDAQNNEGNNAVNDTVENTAVVDGSLGGASGNVGVNVAAGDNNQQANAAAIATADTAFVFGIGVGASAQASIDVDQTNHHNEVENHGVPNNAALNNSANGTSGNVGVNIAAGNSNQQKNDMSVASSETAYTASAYVNVYQDSHDNLVSNESLGGSHGGYGYGYGGGGNQSGVAVINNAVLSGSLNGVSGNVGANIAAGSGNQQSNSLAIAAGCTACPNL
ncbi:hypothetical protein [Halopseudomonas pelagia]|uniref:Uncharacterized protein n=1 Tax=Halopseudomonas pelagia TaxID=553151 RepID=A0AA91TZU1_9GAMM|nr:hypothetical protein [Halopseudomonas pelagia]PCC97806.1 hypothetical protein CO192_19100 [Halopseudomonas pelagia]QFY57346.1 hypothetical protein EAO82_13805 [Halopseudomonas pelagia]